MKKYVALVMTLMMIFSMVSSSFAKTEEEILFRSISWESTYKETMEALENTGITWGERTAYKTGQKELTTGFTVTSKRIMDFSVAGNKVSSVTLWFAYVLDPDTGKPLSEDSAVFVQAKYTFDADTNATGIVTDLKDKMTAVYSNPDDSDSEGFANDYTHIWYWYGGNNSSVRLYHEYTEPFFIKSMASNKLDLTYTSGKMEKLVNAYYDYLKNESNKNTDGL